MNNEAVITEDGQQIKYSEFMGLVNDFGSQFIKKSTVVIIATNTLGGLVGYVGSMKNSHVPLMLGSNISSSYLDEIIQKYRFNYIWAPENWKNKETRILKKCRKIYSAYGYSLFLLNESDCYLNDDLALLLTTSGSTGSSKLVRISRENLQSNTKSIAKYLQIKEGDRAITSLPMNYTYGLSVINSHLYKRGTILLTEKSVLDKRFWIFFKEYEGNFFAGVPYSYELIKKFGIMSENIECLKTYTVAGGKIASEEEKYFLRYAQQYNKKFIVMYGQTEATARISYRPSFNMSAKIGSIGIPIPNGKMWLEDEQGKRISTSHTEGEIVYCGKNVAMGYAKNYGDLEKGYEWKNVLHTGDLGYVDEDNYFYVTGRKDRIIKLNGHRVDLQDMESKILKIYPEYKVKCELEKCINCDMQKRIKVEITCLEKLVDVDDIKKNITKKININMKLIKIIVVNNVY